MFLLLLLTKSVESVFEFVLECVQLGFGRVSPRFVSPVHEIVAVQISRGEHGTTTNDPNTSVTKVQLL